MGSLYLFHLGSTTKQPKYLSLQIFVYSAMINVVAYYSALMNPPTWGKTELAANNKKKSIHGKSFPLFCPKYNKHFTRNEICSLLHVSTSRNDVSRFSQAPTAFVFSVTYIYFIHVERLAISWSNAIQNCSKILISHLMSALVYASIIEDAFGDTGFLITHTSHLTKCVRFQLYISNIHIIYYKLYIYIYIYI